MSSSLRSEHRYLGQLNKHFLIISKCSGSKTLYYFQPQYRSGAIK